MLAILFLFAALAPTDGDNVSGIVPMSLAPPPAQGAIPLTPTPSELSPAMAAPTPARDEEELYARILGYKRQRLRVQPFLRQPFLSTNSMWTNAYSTGSAVWPVPPSDRPLNMPADISGWVILRGASEVISEQELARLAGRAELQRQIDKTQFWRRATWLVSFGVVGAAGISSGVYLMQRQDERDLRTIGFSLITVGAASAVAALLFPVVTEEHVLTPSQAQELADTHNENLRRELELSPTDLMRFEALD